MTMPENPLVQKTFKVNPEFDTRVFIPEKFEKIKTYLLYDSPPQPEQPINTLVLLGTNPRTTPRWYKERLDILEFYAETYPQATIIITGKGPNREKREALGIAQDFIEAEAMQSDALRRGIVGDRIILERDSTNVKENIVNTMNMLPDESITLLIGSGFLGRRIDGYLLKYCQQRGIALPSYYYVDGDVQNFRSNDTKPLDEKLLEVIAGEWSRLLHYAKQGDLQLSDKTPFKPVIA